MHHVAIMKKSWGMISKIITGEKTIESRWYRAKYPPWDRIKPEDVVYFKNSSEPVSTKAEVHQVIQFANLNPQKIRELLTQYGKDDGIDNADIPRYFEMFQYKRHCILIFLKNPQAIRPFQINKKGYGAMSAWISVENVEKITLHIRTMLK